MLSYNDLTDESDKSALNTFAGYEKNHESPPFSINNAKDVTVNLIDVSTAVKNPKYHDGPSKAEIWLRKFMKAHNVDYVKDSYLEGIEFTQDKATDVSLKQQLWFLKLQGATQSLIQQSLTLYAKVLKERSSNFERKMIP